MPKLIPELRERFLSAARARMLESEDGEITIRQVAADCQTAIGTVYNYFPSKHALITAVMQEDWDDIMRRMTEAAENAPDALTGLREIFGGTKDFLQRYIPFWEQYEPTGVTSIKLRRYRTQVFKSMEGPIIHLLTREGVLFDPILPEVIAIMLMTASHSDDCFDKIEPILKKLLS